MTPPTAGHDVAFVEVTGRVPSTRPEVAAAPPNRQGLESTESPAPQRLPDRFRIGRWFLLCEGILVAELAGVAIGTHGEVPAQGSTGFTFWGLTLTPMRSGLLFAFGVIAVVATLNRRATMIVTAMAAVISLALTVLGDIALAAGVPHQWGVDSHNAGLYAVLVVYNFALLTWLFPDLWESRDEARRHARGDVNALQER